ncbi:MULTISPECIES: type IV pilus modification protein PilV [unclassified Pseudomonas]|uniref:type IV pilus modification protein PilV n=1 Tax=unclassified Pseudomonas TaxID=196821 RepID=UPI0035C17B55
MKTRERGMTLLEVLLAMVVLALGVLASGAVQLRALQASEASRRDTQVVQAAQAVLERIRAEGRVDEHVLGEWRRRLTALLGNSAEGRVTSQGDVLVLEARWRAHHDAAWQAIVLQGRGAL